MTKAQVQRLFLLVVVLIGLWGVLIIRLDARWYGVQEAPRVWVAAGVRNYDLYGLDTTGLMVIRNADPATPDTFEYYTHHPPLIIWLPALVTRFTGYNELGVRYGFAVATLLSGVALYLFVRRLFTEKVALWSTFLYALTPMIAYYGRVPGHDQIGMFIILLFGAIMVNWLKQPTRHRLIALMFLTICAVWTAWTAVFFVGCLGLGAMWLGNRAQKISVIGLGVLSIVAFLMLMIFYQLQWDGSIDSILDAFVWRSSNAIDDPGTASFTVFEFIFTTLVHSVILGTVGLFLMAVIGAPMLYRNSTQTAKVMLVALFMGFLSYQLVFRNASFVHDYYKITLMPALAVLGAGCVVYGWQSSRRQIIRPLIVSFVVMAIVHSAGLLYFLHRTGNRPWLDDAISAVNDLPENENIQLMTHLTGKDNLMPLRFYTYRAVDEGIPFGEAQERAQNGESVVYIACPEQDETFVPVTDDYELIEAGECQLYRLN
ncbi:MAG: glycosyltransferase family 39 protein [Aggregatilineales bacterium]